MKDKLEFVNDFESAKKAMLYWHNRWVDENTKVEILTASYEIRECILIYSKLSTPTKIKIREIMRLMLKASEAIKEIDNLYEELREKDRQ